MPYISRNEKHLILFFLILGVACTFFSYQKKTLSLVSTIDASRFKNTHAIININTADAAKLESLPGIGPVLAGDIVAYREAHGGFNYIEELKKVKGIGDKKFEEIKDLVKTSE